MEELFLTWMREYGYGILFLWSILEGESGLVMAGLFAHTGDMQLFTAIATAGLGGFVGDQIYFYIGRLNKSYAYRMLKNQRRKLALARLLLRKYGWPIIFLQRYLYGMRTIILFPSGSPDTVPRCSPLSILSQPFVGVVSLSCLCGILAMRY